MDSFAGHQAEVSERTLENYGVKNNAYTGSCFVLQDRLLGCESVARGLAQAIRYDG
jgi:hypothetical protein